MTKNQNQESQPPEVKTNAQRETNRVCSKDDPSDCRNEWEFEELSNTQDDPDEPLSDEELDAWEESQLAYERALNALNSIESALHDDEFSQEEIWELIKELRRHRDLSVSDDD